MNKESYVFEVNQKSFEQTVLLNSHKIPVFVEFMAVWSGPCNAMEHVFTRLAKEFPEQFIFAKVDADEQAELIKKYKVENLPTVMVFEKGELKRTEMGELKEKEARELLKDFSIFHESDLLREQARDKHLSGDSSAAIIQLTAAIKLDPSNIRVVMDMIQIFLDINEVDQAIDLFSRLPEATVETEMGTALSGQITFAKLAAKTDDIEILNEKLKNNSNDFDVRFDIAIRNISQHQYENAIEHLFYIQKEKPSYKEGAAKEMLVTISNMIAPVNSDLAQEIKRKLSNLLSE